MIDGNFMSNLSCLTPLFRGMDCLIIAICSACLLIDIEEMNCHCGSLKFELGNFRVD